MGNRILVSGATGFIGQHFIKHWRSQHKDIEIWGTGNEPAPPGFSVDYFRQVDFEDSHSVARLVLDCQPNQVVHLVGVIGALPLARQMAVNVVGSENLFQALCALDDYENIRIIQASSAAVYGLTRPEELPISEVQPLRPIGPYGLSKATQDLLGMSFFYLEGLPVINARFFNVIGPGQPDSLVPMTFIKQLKQAQAGQKDCLEVGQCGSRRDFVDVRDVVSALGLLLEKGHPGEAFNVGSGIDISIEKIIEYLFDISGFQVPLEMAAERLKTVDIPCVCADISRISQFTGWQPRISLYESLREMWASQQ
jgi:GDP-4-dehydro-6-deoxy-D-mannose reductase